MYNIETKRFLLSKIMMEDADEVFKILSNPNIIANLNIEIHKSIDDTRKLIENYLLELEQKTKFPYKIIKKMESL